MPYFLGLDVGGTKTFCLIADEQGQVLGFGRAGTGSYEYYGVAAAAEENRKAVQNALDGAGLNLADITQIGMGVAGADLPEDFDMLEKKIYQDLFGDIPRVFRNDSFAALRGGVRSGVGVVVTCGTGCTCAGKGPDGADTRVGGLGPEFGDACTGTSIGEEGLRCVWRARDRIIPPTVLTEKFIARAGCGDVEELFTRMYRNEISPKELEPMAQLVFEAAVDGDPQACDILASGGEYLGAMAVAVAQRLGLAAGTFDVVTAGSVFKGSSPVLLDAMTARLHRQCPQARLVLPEFEPVVGALLLGLECHVAVSEGLCDNLGARLAPIEQRFGIKLKAG